MFEIKTLRECACEELEKAKMRLNIQEKKLTQAERDALPSSKFADPAHRKFPIPDKAHAVAAEAYRRYGSSKVKGKIHKMAGKKGVGPKAKQTKEASPASKVFAHMRQTGHSFPNKSSKAPLNKGKKTTWTGASA